MDRERFREVSRIFERAVALEGPERDRLLDEACAGDAELREEVQSLLDHDRGEGAGIGHPPGLLAEASLTGPHVQLDLMRDRVGPYRLVERLGEGGMGVVYVAEQDEPIRRRVALKLIKLGMDTREVVARFEAERQALAMMDHPNIATVHDAGATDDGRPYFVMELVSGVPIDVYCDRRALSIEARLSLFLQVCQGVQHAHARGVIHRDLKPSNILVRAPAADSEPIAKIIDFGIAKATNQRVAEKTIYTEIGRAVGTPAYMSPEQAGLTTADVDHRADVYSLGVLLYALLVGELPLDWEALSKLAFDEIIRRIREEDPPTPSTRWSRMNAERTRDLSLCRRTNPSAVLLGLRGDLDWITMKAIEKDPDRRYATVSDLADDVRRHLGNEPVSAGPPGVLYKLEKYVRRNRVALRATGAVLLALVAGLLGTTWFAVVATKNEKKAAERAEEVLSLADADDLEALEAEAEALWPASSKLISSLEQWLVRARKLAGRIDTHRDTLARLEALALPAGSGDAQWRFPDTEDSTAAEKRWWHARLLALVGDLESFRDTTVSSVEARLARARTVRWETVDGPLVKKSWQEAIARIKASPEYGPQVKSIMSPQEGLIPLGPDPSSGIEEFAVTETGAVPRRHPVDRELVLSDDMALVLVLLPGGTFTMGAERPRLGVRVAETASGLRVDDVHGNSLANRMGLEVGDVLVRVGGAPIEKAGDLENTVNPLRSGDWLEVEVSRGDKLVPLRLRLENIDPLAEVDEGPVREVSLDAFFVSKFEMTQGQWSRCARGSPNPSHFGPNVRVGEKQHSLLHPVESVTWSRCEKVLRRLGLLLPTEAQWEYAARARTTTVWSTGDDPRSLEGKANLADRSALRAKDTEGYEAIEEWLDDGYVKHAPVGTYGANGFGLADVHGNVYEWCRPLRTNDGGSAGTSEDDDQDVGPETRIFRGGSFAGGAIHARSARRARVSASFSAENIGVRPTRLVVTE